MVFTWDALGLESILVPMKQPEMNKKTDPLSLDANVKWNALFSGKSR